MLSSAVTGSELPYGADIESWFEQVSTAQSFSAKAGTFGIPRMFIHISFKFCYLRPRSNLKPRPAVAATLCDHPSELVWEVAVGQLPALNVLSFSIPKS
jgi:hypothetical protein